MDIKLYNKNMVLLYEAENVTISDLTKITRLLSIIAKLTNYQNNKGGRPMLNTVKRLTTRHLAAAAFSLASVLAVTTIAAHAGDTLEKAKPFAAQWKMNYTILQGNERDDVDDAFGPMYGLPVTVLISRDGKICGKHIGLSGKDVFEREIKSLL